MKEFLFAQLTAIVANTGFRGFEDMKTAKEFMPSQWNRTGKKTNNTPKLTDEERNAAVANMFRTLFVNNGIQNG